MNEVLVLTKKQKALMTQVLVCLKEINNECDHDERFLDALATINHETRLFGASIDELYYELDDLLESNIVIEEE